MSVSLMPSRHRLSLLAGSSLAALTLATSLGLGAAVILSPGVAAAQDECGAVNGNGSGPDGLVCTGAYPTGITYTTNGHLVLNLQGLVSLPGQDLRVTGSAGDNVTIASVDGAGDIQISSTGGPTSGIHVTADAADILIDLQNDAGDGVPSIAGGASGLRAVGSNGGDVVIDISNGVVEGETDYAIYAQQLGGGGAGGDVTVDYGLTLVQGAGGIRAFANTPGSAAIVRGFGSVVANDGSLFGIAALGHSGGVVIEADGGVTAVGTGVVGQTSNGGDVLIDATLVTAGDDGVYGQATGGGSVTINTFEEVLAGADGVTGRTLGGGDVTITINGSVSAGEIGVYADTVDLVGAGAIDITTFGSITGGVRGIFAESGNGGVTVTTAGDVTATNGGGTGIEIVTTGGFIQLDTSAGGLIASQSDAIGLTTQAGGQITATVGNLDSALGVGLRATTENGDIDIEVTGSIESQARGLVLTSDTGDIDVEVGAGGNVGGLFAGMDLFAGTGDVSVIVNGASRGIQIETGATSVGSVDVVVAGGVNGFGGTGDGIAIQGGNGAVTVALLEGAVVNTGAGNSVGILVETGVGDITVHTGIDSTVNGGFGNNGTGVSVASQTGDITVIANGDIFAADTGISAFTAGGSSEVILGAGATIDPNDVGITNISGSTTSVFIGADSTIVIENNDFDDVATGIVAISTATDDQFVGVPSVQVGLGAGSLITIDDGAGGEADGAIGVNALNSGGGSGGVAINAVNGFGVEIVGDGAAGLLARAGGDGHVSVTAGEGTIQILAGDGVDGINNLPFSVGILAASGGGDVLVQSDADISVGGMPGGVTSFGIVGQTSGAGTVAITTGGLVQATHNGVRGITADGDLTIVANSVVVGAIESGISAVSSAGDISVTNNNLVAGGQFGILAMSGAGAVLIDSNYLISSAEAGIVGASAGAGDVTITATNVTASTGVGVAGSSGSGAVSIATSGLIDAGGDGLVATSLGGNIAITNLGGVTAGGVGLQAGTSGAGTITINAGNVTATDIGVQAQGGDGAIVITSTGAIAAGGTGIFALGAGGVGITVSSGSVASGSDVGIAAFSADSNVDVVVSGGSVTGVIGIVGGAGGGGEVDLRTATGTTIAGDIVGLHAVTDAGDIEVELAGDVVSNGAGLVAESGGGDIGIRVFGDVTAGTGRGVLASSDSGNVAILVAGGDVSGSTGIEGAAFGAGDVVIQTTTGTITATAGNGIRGASVGGDVLIRSGGVINAQSGFGVFAASETGSATIDNAAAVSAGIVGLFGVVTEGDGDLSIFNTGAVGSAADLALAGIAGEMGTLATGDLLIRSDGDVYGDFYGISAGQAGVGDLTIDIGTLGGGTLVSGGTVGVDARIANAASTGVLNLNIGDGSTILGGVVGLQTRNDGLGGTIVTLGDGVLIDPDDFGVDMQGGGDQSFIAGDNLTVIVANTDNDATAVGIHVVSTAASDSALDDPAVEITIGAGLDISIDDGAGGDADGAVGILARADMPGTAGVEVVLDGPTIAILGDNSVGVRAVTEDGRIRVRTGSGLISVAGGDGADTAGNFGFSAGIAARSDGGDISIGNGADIEVSNLLAGDSFGIVAVSNTGDILVGNVGNIVSTQAGIRGDSIDGDVTLSNAGDIAALFGNGIHGTSGSGSVSLLLEAGASIQAGAAGIVGSGAGGVDITVESGGSIEAGVAGILGMSANDVTVTLGDNVVIDPEDYGVFLSSGGDATFTAGSGFNLTVANVDGDATAVGITLQSGADFDTDALDPAVELVIGTGFTMNIDDGFGGDADGAVGILASASDPGSTAGIDLEIGDGLLFSIAGDSSIGIRAVTTDGDIRIATGTGLIDLIGGDGTDASGNFAFSAGISASTLGGAIAIDNAADINVANLIAGQAYGVISTAQAGSITINNSGSLFSSDTGVFATSSTGDVNIANSGDITAITNRGVLGLSTAGTVSITQSGAVSAGTYGLMAMTGGAGDVQITNSGRIDADLLGTGAAAILAQHNGTGSISVINSGLIAGSALTGINTNHSGTAGGIGIINSGPIGDAGDPVVIGLNAVISNAGNVSQISIDNSGAITAGNRGVQATHNGTGSVAIANSGEINAGFNAIEVNAQGGAVSIANSGQLSANGSAIRATNTGAGTISVATTGTVFGSTTTLPGRGVIETVTTGTGATVVSTESVVSLAGSAVRTSSNGGAVTVNLGSGLPTVTSVVGAGGDATSWVVDLNNAGAGVSTLNVGSNTILRSVETGIGGYDDLVIRGVGGSVVVNNAGQLHGRVNFAGLTGNVEFNNSSAFSWHTTGLSVFSGGADVVTNTATGSIFTNANGATTTWDFGAGIDTFNNAGLLAVGEQTAAASTLAFSSLERWNNAGRVMFGLNGNTLDGQANDRILSPGTLFTGSAGSLLVMDVNLGSIAQTGCGVLTVADCFSLTGGTTAGVTGILVNDISGTLTGALNPDGIVLVDVSGAGSTAAGHFVLDPGSSFWRADASADGVLDKGLFVYDLILNGNKQHMLVGVPDSEAFEFPTLGEATQSLWHSSTGAWFERQADLRDRLETVASPGVWIKTSSVDQDRTTASTHNVFGSTYTYDTSHDQQTTAVVAGADLVSGETPGGTRWLAGAMLGYIDSDVSFDQSTTRFDLNGVSVGAYGTLVHGPAFVHGLVAANQLTLEYDAPSLAGVLPDGQVDSWGFQVEGGYTLRVGERTFLEPLAGIARVSTRLDSLTVPGATIDWDDQTSLRLSLGGRIGVTADYQDIQARFSLTSRVWHEMDAANRSVIDIGGSSVATLDDFGGTFSELSGSINLDSVRISAFSAFVSAGVKWNDDYRAAETAAGIRYRW